MGLIINLSCIAFGICFLIAAAVGFYRIYKIARSESVASSIHWFILLLFVVGFLAGYVVFAIYLVDERFIDSREVSLVAQIFLWGAVFVFYCAHQFDRTLGLMAKSRKEYHSLFESVSEGVYRITPQGKYLSVNLSFAQMFGFSSPREMISVVTNITNQFYQKNIDRKKLIDSLARQGYIRNYELHVKKKSGERFWILINARAVKGSDGVVQYYEGTSVDITEHKQTETALLKANHAVVDLVESVPLGIFQTTPGREGAFRQVNQSMVATYEAGTREELIKHPVVEFYRDRTQRGVVSEIAMQKGRFKGVVAQRTLTGKPIWVELTLVKKIGEDGQTYFDGILEDVTIREDSRMKASQLDFLKNRFIQIVSHQMRTPLTAIRWSLENLLSGELGGKLSAEHEDTLRVIYNSNLLIIDRLEDLILSLDIENRVVRLEKEKTYLRSLIESVLIELGPAINLKKIKADFEAPSAKYSVNIDPNRMKQVLRKIIDNAIRYSHEGGEVKISLEPRDNEVYVTISDKGIGIPEADQSKTFEKFFRASNASVMSPDASGLGLFIAKNIIELHGGKLWFNSREGVGSDFYFKLPIA